MKTEKVCCLLMTCATLLTATNRSAMAEKPLETYNHTLPGLNPAGSDQAQYLNNRLLLLHVKSAEQNHYYDNKEIERDKNVIDRLRRFDADLVRLIAGSPNSKADMDKLWYVLQTLGPSESLFGDDQQSLPPMPLEYFRFDRSVLEIIAPTGHLEGPPALLREPGAPDHGELARLFRELTRDFATDRGLHADVLADFLTKASSYHDQALQYIKDCSRCSSAKGRAWDYVNRLRGLTSLLYNLEEKEERQIVADCVRGRVGFRGGDFTALVQFMLHYHLLPKHGSSAQVAMGNGVRALRDTIRAEINEREVQIESRYRDYAMSGANQGAERLPVDEFIPVSARRRSL